MGARKTAGEMLVEKGRIEGRSEGRLEGRRELLLQIMETRFGPLSPAVVSRIESASLDELTTWANRFALAEALIEVWGDA